MTDNSSRGKMSFFWLHSINVKAYWTHLAEKKSLPGAKIIQYSGYHESI